MILYVVTESSIIRSNAPTTQQTVFIVWLSFTANITDRNERLRMWPKLKQAFTLPSGDEVDSASRYTYAYSCAQWLTAFNS